MAYIFSAWRIFFALLEAHRGRAPLIYISRGHSRRCTGYDSVAHPVICFSELGGCRGLLCGRAGGRAARPRAPGCRPRRGSRSSRGSKIYAQGVYFWAYMEVLKGISSFKRPIRRACVGAGTGHSGPGSRQRTAAPPRPGHSLREYMQPALASASVEVAQTSGGCDSRRRARQEKPGPPARSRRSEADSRVGRWNHRTSPSAHPHPHPRRLGGVPARKEVACDLRSTG